MPSSNRFRSLPIQDVRVLQIPIHTANPHAFPFQRKTRHRSYDSRKGCFLPCCELQRNRFFSHIHVAKIPYDQPLVRCSIILDFLFRFRVASIVLLYRRNEFSRLHNLGDKGLRDGRLSSHSVGELLQFLPAGLCSFLGDHFAFGRAELFRPCLPPFESTLATNLREIVRNGRSLLFVGRKPNYFPSTLIHISG